MPIYEFRCEDCDHRFEQFVRPSGSKPADAVGCPSCGSQQLQRQVSLFAVDSEGTRHMHRQQARKAGMKDAKDRRQAEIDEIKHIQEHHG